MRILKIFIQFFRKTSAIAAATLLPLEKMEGMVKPQMWRQISTHQVQMGAEQVL